VVDEYRGCQHCAVSSYSYSSTLSIARCPLPDYTNLIVNSVHSWKNHVTDYRRASVILRSALPQMSGHIMGVIDPYVI